MDELRITRRSLVGAGAIGLGAMLAANAAFADEGDLERVNVLRWDLTATQAQPDGNVALVPGGKDVATVLTSGNPKSIGDFVTLTGSGTVRLNKGVVTGGGTFTNQHATGIESARLGHGVYYVTGVNSFENRGGKLPSNVIDTIDKSKQALGGILSLNVLIVAPPKTTAPPGSPPDTATGLLKIHVSSSVGLTGDTEGIEFILPNPNPAFTFNFVQTSGTALFHSLDED